MKLFPLGFIAIVICQIDASTIFGRLIIGRPRRPYRLPDSINPPCSTPPQLQSNRLSDCLLCYTRPCTTCLTAQLQSLKQCPPCLSTPCPLCAGQNDATNNLVKSGPTPLGYPSARAFQELKSTRKPLSDDCTPLEIESATEELVHKVAAILPTVCFMSKSSLESSFPLIDIACLFRGAGVLGFIRHHLPELIEYLRSRSFLSEEGFLDRDEDGNTFVIPYSSRSLCRRHLLGEMPSFVVDERAESSPRLQNSQRPPTTLLPEGSFDYRPVTETPRR